MARRRLVLSKDLRRALRAGHPWIFDRALRGGAGDAAPGEIVVVADRRGPFAIGYADPGAAIAVRVLDLDPAARIDGVWVEARARRAGRLRRAAPGLEDTDAVRLIHGENDGMPGLVLDLYAGTAAVALDGPGAAALWRPHLARVVAGLGAAGFEIARAFSKEHGVLLGDPPPEHVVVREGAARFEVDVRRGQKTGFFLDQRPNRAAVEAMAAGARVLNLFSYTGGFSVRAALGGARSVVSVDSGAPVIAAARRNLAHSGLDPARHELVCADAFAFAADAAARGRRWDLVVCDPPSFAPSARARAKALAAYRRINALALAVTADGGALVTCSCSSHVTAADLQGAVAEAAREVGRELRLTGVRGPGPDHPELPGFPEGHYLRCLVLRG